MSKQAPIWSIFCTFIFHPEVSALWLEQPPS